MSNEKRPLGPQTSVGRKQAERIICLQMPIFFFLCQMENNLEEITRNPTDYPKTLTEC